MGWSVHAIGVVPRAGEAHLMRLKDLGSGIRPRPAWAFPRVRGLGVRVSDLGFENRVSGLGE